VTSLVKKKKKEGEDRGGEGKGGKGEGGGGEEDPPRVCISRFGGY
jgi:hypothetical protein